MGFLRKALDESLLQPIRAMRRRYLPLLMIYFAAGASGLSGIAESFWVKEELGLTAEGLVALGVWLTVPWTVKMVFGQLVDGVPILGSRRRAYVFLGAGLMASGQLMLAGAAGKWITFARPEVLYIMASVLAVLGTVIQDVVADAMSTEVVDRTDEHGAPRPADDVKADLGMVQVLGRLAIMFGAFATAYLGGRLAGAFSRETVFLISLVIPVISVTGSLLVRADVAEESEVDWRILGGGLVFGVFTVAMGLSQAPYGQEIVFLVSMVVVCALLWITVAELGHATKLSILYAAIVIFVFRAMPSVGPGGQWWQIDKLGFDEEFFGVLGQIGTGLAITGIWFGSGFVTRRPVTRVLAFLTIVGTLLSLPTIGLFYGLADWTQQHFGFGARTIAVIDTSVASPFNQLSMIPMLTLIAIHAPAGKRATWFALMASLMNLALTAAGLVTKLLNEVFVVQRGSYGELGPLMITVTAIGLLVPLGTILLVGRRIRAADSARAASMPAASSA
jgi:MFS family permease